MANAVQIQVEINKRGARSAVEASRSVALELILQLAFGNLLE